jgi:hypothetical protein
MDPTTAIVQFIGIVLFSAQVPGDPGLHAIMPRIGHVHKSEFHQLPDPDAETNMTRIGSAGVENHVSVIMYRDEDRLYPNGGWKSDGTLANKWSYVALNGERIRFLANGTNGKAGVPAGLPRIGASSSCGVTAEAPSLSEDFLPPYRGAIGVVDIPEGTLSSCESSGRIDSRLRLETNGVLVITATKKYEDPKALVLKGNAVVFVANIPPYALLRNTDLTIGEPHWMAYNAMLAQTCAARPHLDEKDFAQVKTCDISSLGESYLRARKTPPIEIRMIDSGCSNTQWAP